MARYYLYMLLAIFILINGVDYFDSNIKHGIKQEELFKYKLKKQKLYDSHIDDIKKILEEQKIKFIENRKLFFDKDKKGTIIFSDIQNNIQSIFKDIGGKITQLNSGAIIKNDFYIKYPISLTFDIIPEDLNVFFKKLYLIKKYLFIDSIHIYGNKRKKVLNIKITLIGFQLK